VVLPYPTGSLWSSMRSFRIFFRILPDLSVAQGDLSRSSSVFYRISLDLNKNFPDLLLSRTGSIWTFTRSFRILRTWSLRILSDLSGSCRISSDLTRSLRTLPDLWQPDIARIFPNLAGYFRIFTDLPGSPYDRARGGKKSLIPQRTHHYQGSNTDRHFWSLW
jgi:hypothetical protein